MSIIAGVRTPNEIIQLVLDDFNLDKNIAAEIENRLAKGLLSASDNNAILVITVKKDKLEWAYVEPYNRDNTASNTRCLECGEPDGKHLFGCKMPKID